MPALPAPAAASRAHLSRLMKIWRSAGWPSRDALEIDLLAAGWIETSQSGAGHETLRLTAAGIDLLARARLAGQRALSRHDRLAERVARQLKASGRIVWRELALRSQVAVPAAEPAPVLTEPAPAADGAYPSASAAGSALTLIDALPEGHGPAAGAKARWRMARLDVYSVRNTSVAAYLHPVVHEVKVSRADLLSDLRHASKRESYQWLCSECYYVFPAGLAEAHEIPDAFGIWVLHGEIEDGRLELLRPARHARCDLPFAVWLALAKATPLRLDDDPLQPQLGEVDEDEPTATAPASPPPGPQPQP